jgi:hypothetical protein
MKAQSAKCSAAFSVLIAVLGCFTGLATAGPMDGPVLEAQTIVISGNIRGEITNGTQGKSGKVCVIFCVNTSTSTKHGQLNVNGIVQQGGSVLRANTIVLQNDLNHDLHNKEGAMNYKGIMQIGR